MSPGFKAPGAGHLSLIGVVKITVPSPRGNYAADEQGSVISSLLLPYFGDFPFLPMIGTKYPHMDRYNSLFVTIPLVIAL